MARPPRGGWGAGPNRLAQKRSHPLKASRFKRSNDLEKPRRPVTGYDVFFRNTWHDLKERRPDLTSTQLFSEIGRLWREGTCWEDRQICYDFADWEKEKYDFEIKQWRIRRQLQKQRESQKSTSQIERSVIANVVNKSSGQSDSDQESESSQAYCNVM